MSVVAVAESIEQGVFFTRWEHGGVPVTRHPEGKWVLHHPGGVGIQQRPCIDACDPQRA